MRYWMWMRCPRKLDKATSIAENEMPKGKVKVLEIHKRCGGGWDVEYVIQNEETVR